MLTLLSVFVCCVWELSGEVVWDFRDWQLENSKHSTLTSCSICSVVHLECMIVDDDYREKTVK